MYLPAADPTLLFFIEVLTLDEDTVFLRSSGNHSLNAALHPGQQDLDTKVLVGVLLYTLLHPFIIHNHVFFYSRNYVQSFTVLKCYVATIFST
jgi:hypothetical protein